LVNLKNTVNESGGILRIGDKIVADIQDVNGVSHLITKKVLASQQPVACSDREYLKALRIYIINPEVFLDFGELNHILGRILGISVYHAEVLPQNYHIAINLIGEDEGTKNCPFTLALFNQELSSTYPLAVRFPQVSKSTMKYLKMLYPREEIRYTPIFALRLVHFLLHRLGYNHDHMHQKLEEKIAYYGAHEEGDPSKVPLLNFDKVCLCDWESLHFLAVQPNPKFRPFENMLCDECKKRNAILLDFNELNTVININRCSITKSKLPMPLRTEKRIFYVIESRKNGYVISETPYKSKVIIDITKKNWIGTTFETCETLSNIFVPQNLFDKRIEAHKGDKLLIKITLETRREEKDNFGYILSAKRFKVEAVIRKNVKIINDSRFFSKIKPFRQKVILKIGPEIAESFVKRVAKKVTDLTGWRVKIDKSSYEDLKKTYEILNKINTRWKETDLKSRGKLIADIRKTISKLPKNRDVEDTFSIPVYVFPEKFGFLDDVFGTIASGLSIDRIFAVVNVFSGLKPDYDVCRDCITKPINVCSEEMTALFVTHEVLHIATGLRDHVGCRFCRYSRKEMEQFRRYYCEECIREGNDEPHKNCLMSYVCLNCISLRMSELSLSQILCEHCRKKLLPPDQFAARQAARMNHIIYRNILFDLPTLIKT